MTAQIVVDASLTFRYFVPNPQQQMIRQQLDSWLRQGSTLVAPMLWIYEVTSAIAKTVQAGALTEAEGERMVALIHRFPIDLVGQDQRLSLAALAWSRRLRSANAYDSAYLALAEALQCELWTVDQRLVNAARQPWLRLFQE